MSKRSSPLISEQRRRARGAAQGIAIASLGAMLLLASRGTPWIVTGAVLLVGLTIAVRHYRRRVAVDEVPVLSNQPEDAPPALDGSPFVVVDSALAELRKEAAATEELLGRVRARREESSL